MQLTLPLKFYPPKRKLKTNLDAVVHAMEHMDADMLNTLLSDEYTYECVPKKRFVEIVDDMIVELGHKGNHFLKAETGFCDHVDCNYLKHGYRFTGEKTGDFFDMIIEEKEGFVSDMYHCTKFCTHSQKVPKGKIISTQDFMNKFDKQAGIDDYFKNQDMPDMDSD